MPLCWNVQQQICIKQVPGKNIIRRYIYTYFCSFHCKCFIKLDIHTTYIYKFNKNRCPIFVSRGNGVVPMTRRKLRKKYFYLEDLIWKDKGLIMRKKERENWEASMTFILVLSNINIFLQTLLLMPRHITLFYF